MATPAPEFCVLGIGHLAAAVRVQLPLFGLMHHKDHAQHRNVHRVLIACSDYPCASSFTDANRRAVREGSPILFARLCSSTIELGPLVVPLESPCFDCQAARRWDFSPNDVTACFMSATPVIGATLNPDSRLKSVAHVGALLLARELTAARLDARRARLVGHVVKFDPPCIDPEIISLTRAADCAVCGEGRRVAPAA
jgi:hypothetical protein